MNLKASCNKGDAKKKQKKKRNRQAFEKKGKVIEKLQVGIDSLPGSLCDEIIQKLVKTKAGHLTINLPFIRI